MKISIVRLILFVVGLFISTSISFSEGSVYKYHSTKEVTEGRVWSIPVSDGDNIVLSIEENGKILAIKYDASMNALTSPVTVASSNDTANKDTIADHKHIYQNGAHYIVFSTSGNGSGGYMYLVKLDKNLSRMGIVNVVQNDPPTNDMFLVGDGTYIHVGKFVPGTGHKVYTYNSSLELQRSITIGGGINTHANGVAVLSKGGYFYQISPETLAPGQGSHFYLIVFDSQWNVVQNKRTILTDNNMLGLVTAVNIDPYDNNYIIHYPRTNTGGGPIYRAVFDQNWDLISYSSVISGNYTRPHGDFHKGNFYLGYDGGRTYLSKFTVFPETTYSKCEEIKETTMSGVSVNVIKGLDGRYKAYYMSSSLSGIALSESTDGITWSTPTGVNFPSVSGVSSTTNPWIFITSDNKYRMIYEGQDNNSNRHFYSAISTNGTSFTYERTAMQGQSQDYTSNNKSFISVPTGIKLNDGRWRMYFVSAGDRIRSAISSDEGITWLRDSGTRQTNGVDPAIVTLSENSGYGMFYTDWTDDYRTKKVFFATSYDGLNFTTDDNPFIVVPESYSIVDPEVIALENGRYRMYYSVGSGSQQTNSTIYTCLIPQSYIEVLKYPNRIQKVYVAYYGRPADPGGQDYWVSRLQSEGGNLNAIMNAFGTSEEFNRRYGNLSNSVLIDTIYQQMFSRTPDSGGKAFYLDQLNRGLMTLQGITLNVLDGAQNEDLTVINNKLEVSHYFTGKVRQGCSYDSEQRGVNFLSGITAASSTVTAAKAAIDSYCGF